MAAAGGDRPNTQNFFFFFFFFPPLLSSTQHIHQFGLQYLHPCIDTIPSPHLTHHLPRLRLHLPFTMHQALLAAGLLPLAFASPVANDKKHKTTTTTVTLAPVSTSVSTDTVSGGETVVHSWVLSNTAPPVTFQSSVVVIPEPTTSYFSEVFTLHDSSVYNGKPTTVPMPSVSQPRPSFTDVHITSVVHTGAPTPVTPVTSAFTTTIVNSAPTAVTSHTTTTIVKSKPSPKTEIIDTTVKGHQFKLVARTDEQNGKIPSDDPSAPENSDSDILHIWRYRHDLYIPAFGNYSGLSASWTLHKGHLATEHDDQTKDTYYWGMVDVNKALDLQHNYASGWHVPILSTNEDKHSIDQLHNAKLGYKDGWQLVRVKDSNNYSLQNAKHPGYWISCLKFHPMTEHWGIVTPEGSALFWGDNTHRAGHEGCQRINIYVSTDPLFALLPLHLDITAAAATATVVSNEHHR